MRARQVGGGMVVEALAELDRAERDRTVEDVRRWVDELDELFAQADADEDAEERN